MIIFEVAFFPSYLYVDQFLEVHGVVYSYFCFLVAAFGQSSNAPFGASSVFGQNSNASSNPFTAKPFGSTTTFGTPTGGSVYGGTSTGVFGLNSPSLGQQSTYGSPSPPAFGTSTVAFDTPLAPSFGTSSSSFGG